MDNAFRVFFSLVSTWLVTAGPNGAFGFESLGDRFSSVSLDVLNVLLWGVDLS